VPVVLALDVGDFTAHAHSAATPTAQVEDLAIGISATSGLSVKLLLPRYHQVEVLATAAHELGEPDMVAGVAAQVGQTRQLSDCCCCPDATHDQGFGRAALPAPPARILVDVDDDRSDHFNSPG
jgi:hypothetical protein